MYFDYQEQELTTMQPRIRIIKRSAGGNTNALPANEIEKTVQQREREMANAVKSWVAEWQARNRALRITAASLVPSVRNSMPSPTPQFEFSQ